jgi:hypothetical protein
MTFAASSCSCPYRALLPAARPGTRLCRRPLSARSDEEIFMFRLIGFVVLAAIVIVLLMVFGLLDAIF